MMKSLMWMKILIWSSAVALGWLGGSIYVGYRNRAKLRRLRMREPGAEKLVDGMEGDEDQGISGS